MTRAAQNNPKQTSKSKGSTSLTAVSNKRHKHDWRLIDQGDTQLKPRPLPKGKWISRGGLFGGTTYIPGVDKTMFYEHLIDTINSFDMPYDTYQKWQCPECGEIKTYWQHHEGTTSLLNRAAKE